MSSCDECTTGKEEVRLAQPPDRLLSNPLIQWQQSLGGTSYDEANSIQQTMRAATLWRVLLVLMTGDVSGHHGEYGYYGSLITGL
jgi:hypothetical protein